LGLLLLWMAAILAAFAAQSFVMVRVLGYVPGVSTRALLPGQAHSPLLDLHGSVPAFVALGTCTLLLVGLDEELQLRGFVLDRLGRVIGGRRSAWARAVGTSLVLCGLLHVGNGLGNAVFAAGMGVMFGAVCLRTGRNLWVVVIAHSAYDTIRVMARFLRYGGSPPLTAAGGQLCLGRPGTLEPPAPGRPIRSVTSTRPGRPSFLSSWQPHFTSPARRRHR
jgi:membrane protease YdiL (CAAX protease family)